MSVESVMPSNHLILCHPLLLPPSIFPSIRVFSSESVLCIRWPKYWSFSISASSKYSGLISFRIDWLDLLAAQGTPKNLLQHHSSKASILRLKHTSNPPWQQLIYLPSNLVLLQECKSETQGVTLGSSLCSPFISNCCPCYLPNVSWTPTTIPITTIEYYPYYFRLNYIILNLN